MLDSSFYAVQKLRVLRPLAIIYHPLQFSSA
jgi:hypothetical protein